MFIQTEATDHPDRMRFLPGRSVLDAGVVEFPDPEAAAGSPLALRLFGVASVEAVELGADYIAVTRAPEADWSVLRSQVLQAVMEHFLGSEPVVADDTEDSADGIIGSR